jgi:hypothetical protein
MRSVFGRYDIVSERDLREASDKLAAHAGGPSFGQSDVQDTTAAMRKYTKEMVGRDGIEPPTPGFSGLGMGGTIGRIGHHPEEFQALAGIPVSAPVPDRARW